MSKSTKIIAALGVVAGIGVAALPLSTFAANTADVTVKVMIGEQLSLSMDLAASDTEQTMTASEIKTDEMKSTAKVSTNHAAGYTLTVIDKDTNTALVNESNPSATIPAIAVEGALSSGTAAWGLQVDSAYPGTTISTAQWSPIPASTSTALVVRNSGALATAVSDEASVVKYGVSTAAGQASGTYSDIITYTVTAN
ncbi:MAG: hypothetical protein Q4A30_01280 [Candidatus Saccharibacteria bacterium]|nr:hypothetical protein [Candidatus Saccharibacteria bacterium]